ncbi:MAG: DUF6152 family protein [Steroidobacteraceae bacterium]
MKRVVIVLASLFVSISAFAHHSGAMFDRAKTVKLEGTVKEFLFTNPHTWLRLDVMDKDGNVEVWDIEASAPVRMVKWGLSPQTIHTGDKVTVNMHPMIDGRKAGAFVDIILADGKFITTNADVNSYAK